MRYSDHDSDIDRDDYLTDTCRQCHETVVVDADEPRPDGPFVCDSCIRETVNRAAAQPPAIRRAS